MHSTTTERKYLGAPLAVVGRTLASKPGTAAQTSSTPAATPARTSSVSSPNAASPSSPFPPRARVFVTDDHQVVRRGLAAMIAGEPDLEFCGEADDCATATSAIARLNPDVVIVDISLRGNNGLELVKNIRSINPETRILVLSGYDESVYALRAIRAGAKAYVMKQDVAAKVIDGIRSILKGQMFVSERISGQIFNRFVGGREDIGESRVSCLTDRELEVATLIGGGLATREIAVRLRMSVKTVETHRAHLKSKLNLSTATQLVQFCVTWVEECKRMPSPETVAATSAEAGVSAAA